MSCFQVRTYQVCCHKSKPQILPYFAEWLDVVKGYPFFNLSIVKPLNFID